MIKAIPILFINSIYMIVLYYIMGLYFLIFLLLYLLYNPDITILAAITDICNKYNRDVMGVLLVWWINISIWSSWGTDKYWIKTMIYDVDSETLKQYMIINKDKQYKEYKEKTLYLKIDIEIFSFYWYSIYYQH